MHHERLDHWQHDHVFGQDLKRSGETRTLIVVGLTLAMMGIIGAILVTRWSWHLLKDASKVLLDEQHQDMAEAVKQAVEDDDATVSDLHVWAIGPNIHAAIVSVVSHQPESPTAYKERIQASCQSLVHVTLEPLRCD